MTGKMLHIRTLKALLLTLMLCMAGCGTALAQQFSVTKFRVLPNDVSAFITPVRDLNDEAWRPAEGYGHARVCLLVAFGHCHA